MHNSITTRARSVAALSGGAAITLLGSCAAPATRETPIALTSSAEPGAAAAVAGEQNPSPPAPGTARRVGGDLSAAITGQDGDFRAGPCRIDTPLPAGYPPPTPPDAIDLKTYPGVRLAEVTGTGNPDAGMNRAFWPLFNHIKKHDIAMTSPVEMSFDGLTPDAPRSPDAWSMAFLYRTPELNATGQDGQVTVRDAQPVTVVAFGLRGDYSMALVERGMRAIEDWFAANPDWEPAGNWRTLYYNGPTLRFWNKWAEVQMPVRLAALRIPTPAPTAQAASAASASNPHAASPTP